MAKAKRNTTRVAKKPGIAAVRQVKQAVKELQNFYQLGHKVLKADQKNPHKNKYSLGVSVEIAARIGRSRDYVDKARKFASTYTKAELDELCRLRRPDGMPLGPRHVIGLLRIKNKRDRKRFQRKAVVEGWSTRQVAAEISKLLSTGGSGGRRPKTPKTVDDALMQVLTMSSEKISSVIKECGLRLSSPAKAVRTPRPFGWRRSNCLPATVQRFYAA